MNVYMVQLCAALIKCESVDKVKLPHVCGDKKYHLSQKFNLVTVETILQLSLAFMLCLFG